jgi:hypothetical protein
MDHVPGDRGHRVPEELSEFLLRTSVADVLDAELCEALSGRSGSADVLRRTEADLQFVMATGPGRDTYRYHAASQDAALGAGDAPRRDTEPRRAGRHELDDVRGRRAERPPLARLEPWTSLDL